MKTWQWIALGMVSLSLAGCRTDPAIPLLERDNRLKEDEIYRLRWRIEDLEETIQELQRCPVTPPPTRGETTAPRTRPSSEPMSRPPSHIPPLPTHEEPVTGPSIPNTLPDLKPPSVTVPENAAPENEIPERFLPKNQRPGDSDRSNWSPAEAAARSGSAVTIVDNTSVAHITINPSLTGGYGRGGRTGDGGLLMVVEPRDLMGKVLAAPGDISVVLLDPAESGAAARIGRWDFTAAQTADLVNGDPDPGIYLALPWPAGRPRRDQLKLFVRYVTRDGRKLQVERPISIAATTSQAVEWSPREAGPIVETPAPAERWRESPPERLPNVEPERPRSPEWAAERTPSQDSPSERTASRDAEPARRRPVWSPNRIY